MQKKIKLSAQLKKKLIQKIWIQKEIFENFDKNIKNISKKIKLEKNSENKKIFLENILELQKNFFSEIEKNIQEKMMDFAKKWDFKYATILRNILFEFQNEAKSEENNKYIKDLKEIFWIKKDEKNKNNFEKISCINFLEKNINWNLEKLWCKITFENWIYQKNLSEIFEWKNSEEIFENEIKKLENFAQNNKKNSEKYFWKKLNKKDFWKIFKKIYKNNSKNILEKNLENILKIDKKLEELNIKTNYYWFFEKEKNFENKSVNFDEKKLEDFFIWFIPVWKFDNKNYEIVFENPDKDWILFEKNFEEIFWDFIKYLWKNFSEKNFYIYWNSKIFEKNFLEFGIKKIKNLNTNSEILSQNFWIIPEIIAKFWPSKNKNSWFIWKFSTWKKEENLKIPDLFLINWDEKIYKNILEKNLKIFSQDKKIFLINKNFLEKNTENKKNFPDWIKFLEKIFAESERFLEKSKKISEENNSLEIR